MSRFVYIERSLLSDIIEFFESIKITQLIDSSLLQKAQSLNLLLQDCLTLPNSSKSSDWDDQDQNFSPSPASSNESLENSINERRVSKSDCLKCTDPVDVSIFISESNDFAVEQKYVCKWSRNESRSKISGHLCLTRYSTIEFSPLHSKKTHLVIPLSVGVFKTHEDGLKINVDVNKTSNHTLHFDSKEILDHCVQEMFLRQKYTEDTLPEEDSHNSKHQTLISGEPFVSCKSWSLNEKLLSSVCDTESGVFLRLAETVNPQERIADINAKAIALTWLNDKTLLIDTQQLSLKMSFSTSPLKSGKQKGADAKTWFTILREAINKVYDNSNENEVFQPKDRLQLPTRKPKKSTVISNFWCKAYQNVRHVGKKSLTNRQRSTLSESIPSSSTSPIMSPVPSTPTVADDYLQNPDPFEEDDCYESLHSEEEDEYENVNVFPHQYQWNLPQASSLPCSSYSTNNYITDDQDVYLLPTKLNSADTPNSEEILVSELIETALEESDHNKREVMIDLLKEITPTDVPLKVMKRDSQEILDCFRKWQFLQKQKLFCLGVTKDAMRTDASINEMKEKILSKVVNCIDSDIYENLF